MFPFGSSAMTITMDYLSSHARNRPECASTLLRGGAMSVGEVLPLVGLRNVYKKPHQRLLFPSEFLNFESNDTLPQLSCLPPHRINDVPVLSILAPMGSMRGEHDESYETVLMVYVRVTNKTL